eukprot:gene11851-5180_t
MNSKLFQDKKIQIRVDIAKEDFDKIINENEKLTGKNEELKRKNEELRNKHDDLEKKFNDLTMDSSKRITNLDERVNQLQKQNNDLKEENDKLMKENKELQLKIQELEKKVEDIELKLFQFDSREVVRAIENYIVLDVLGSKKKMIKNSVYTIKELQNTTDYENSEWSKDKDGKIICQIISYVKKIGDDLVHTGKLSTPKEKVIRQLKSATSDIQDDDETVDYNSIVEKMIKILEDGCKR